MDLESESVEDNEVLTVERLESVGGNKIENNASLGVEYGGDELLADTKAKDVGVSESLSSPPLPTKSPAGSSGSSPLGTTTKGYGLKKWRRIKREFNKEGGSNADTGKILKRGLSTSAAISSKKGEGSLSSTKAMLKVLGVGGDGFPLHGSSLDSRLAVGPSFAVGTDSENSEDRSSKSSTAAGISKLRHENPALVGHGRDKNRMKSLSGKNLGNSVQRGQQGKSWAETSKKPRGARVKIEKENSHSSMESDSRSSNFVFMLGANAVSTNGRQGGKSIYFDGENGDDEAQGVGQHLGKELQTGYGKEHGGEFEDLSRVDLAADLSSEVKEAKVENHRSSKDQDSLVESILTLQSAQEELEKEVQLLREIGTEHISIFDGSNQGNGSPSEFASFDSKIHEGQPSYLLHSGEITSSSRFLETEAVSLKRNINLLESKLEEANAMLKLKEAKVVELEYALKNNESPKEEIWRTIKSQNQNNREMEAEVEGLFAQKIEAEVEYLAISRTIQKLKVATVDQAVLVEEQKTLASEQAKLLNKLGDAENKAAVLKRRAEKLEAHCEDIAKTDQVLKLHNRVCKVSCFFVVQFLLLFVVLVCFYLQLSTHYAGVVPT